MDTPGIRVSVLALLFSCVGGPVPLAAQQPSATSRFVDVDGARIHVVTSGLAERVRGQPVVVFESGGGTPLSTWDPVLPAVAAVAPVVRYDRVGTGVSPWDSLPPTPERVVARLRGLLSKLGVTPPYILVGHSWGGALVRYFAGKYPDQVAGLLYVDPTDITQTPADEIAVFQSIGGDQMARAARDSFYMQMERGIQHLPGAIRAEAAVVMGLMQTELDARGLGPAPNVPTTVILAGRVARIPRGNLPFDPEAYAKVMHESRRARLRTWVRGGGSFIEAANSAHFVHVDEPALVIEAIRKLVQQPR